MGANVARTKPKVPTVHSRLIGNGNGDEFGSISTPPPAKEELPYPRSVFYILATEFCERFSFYGMKTILVFYLKYQLDYSEDSATVLYHSWTMLCYFTPIIGALLADLWLGRYKTILWMSILYLVGNIIVALSAAPPVVPTISAQNIVAVFGLILVAFGTGGIKPCVSAFGGEQFELPQQQRQLAAFFAVFYFSINFGALLSTLISPILREDTKCFNDDCYFAAFGLPAMLMTLALVVFVSGSPLYKKFPATGTIITSTASCIWLGMKGKMKSMYGKAVRVPHWLDHARAKHDDDMVEDVRVFTSIMVLFLPLPIFWALFDQQGSRWTFQASRMDGNIGIIEVHPDQIQFINPLLILTLVPILEKWGYPLLAKVGCLTKPLQRVTVGGVLAGVAFAIAAIVESQIVTRKANGDPPLSMMWLIPQYFVITLGEVLFSISGLQFSFTEAPSSMKSVMQACWLLTISFGNLIVVFVAVAFKINSQTAEFALFSCLMMLDMLLFGVMAHYYQPYKPAKTFNSDSSDESPTIQNGPDLSASGYQPPLEDDPYPSLYILDDLNSKDMDDEEMRDSDLDAVETEVYNSSNNNALPSYSPLNKPPTR